MLSLFPSQPLPTTASSSRKIASKLAGLCVLLLAGAATLASAQTAHFSGAQTVLASGFQAPLSIAVDHSGNLYLADTFNNAVKELLAVNGSVPASPTIKTLGSGFSTPFGVGVDGNGNVYVADSGNAAVEEILAVDGVIPDSPVIKTLGSKKLGSGFNKPEGVAIDKNGNVFVVDNPNNALYEILAVNGSIPASPTIRTVNNGLYSPRAVAVDGNGNVYAPESLNGVQEFLAADGSLPASPVVKTLVNDLPNGTAGLSVDSLGNVYVADWGNSAVYQILTVNGSIPASPAINSIGSGLSDPYGVAVDGNGYVYIADSYNNRVLKESLSKADFGSVNVGTASSSISINFSFDTAGTLGSTSVLTQGATGLDFTDIGTGNCTANTAYSAGETCYINVTFTPKFPGTRYGAVVLKNTAGNVIATGYLQGTGIGPQVIYSPAPISTPVSGISGSDPIGVAVDGSGNVYLANLSNAVKKIPFGCTSASCVTTLGGGSGVPSGVAVDGSGNIYVADQANAAVKVMSPGCTSASCVMTLGGGFSDPLGVAVDGSGNVYVADFLNDAVKEIPAGCASASCVTTLGGNISYPRGVAVDGNGNVYVTDTGNLLVKEIPVGCTSASCVMTLGGGFSDPLGVAVDGSGNVYVVDGEDATDAGTVEEIPSGCLSTSCVTTLSDGLDFPSGVAVDGSGNVYVVDYSNSGLYEIARATAPSLTFPSTQVNATSAAQTVTITNDGNAALDFSAISYPKNFPESTSATNDCKSTTSLAPNLYCTLTIDFTPLSVGALTGSLVLTDNALNVSGATQSIALSGTGNPLAQLLTPTPSSTLTSSTATFTWSKGTGATAYKLILGTTVGGSNLYNSYTTTATTATVKNLPTSGATIYATLYTEIGGKWQSNAYTYTEANLIPAVLTSLASNSTLSSSTVTFTWSTGTGVSAYKLILGTTLGGSDLYNSYTTTATTKTVYNLPTNGTAIYAMLYSQMGGVWSAYIYTFTAK